MATRRRKTSASSSRKKTTASSRKKSSTRKSTAGAKRSTGARKTTARKTSGTRKKSTATRKKTGGGTKKKTTSSRSGRASGGRKSTARKSSAKRTSSRASATRRPSRRQLELRSLDDVLRDQIADLASAERQLVEALPKVARAASSPQLREAFEHHLEETRGHVRRLDTIIGQLGGIVPDRCEGMAGLVSEGEEVVEARGDAAAKDAALIAAAQRIEHYEIAAYGTARTLADELNLDDARDLLNETLDEESNADALLTKIATGGFFGSGRNEEAAQ
jgi:ferritin-like metal-binding protein YciE